ncbi:unnamed protein product [Rhizoctonia solani]|uniref:Uncharacterized protein n=1 Tax=Rhizoctonia solani TaxID=456999 RepID=A0A8H3BVD0_9AGAM|nr:unnamed protein product [Rhizoctonia solani]
MYNPTCCLDFLSDATPATSPAMSITDLYSPLRLWTVTHFKQLNLKNTYLFGSTQDKTYLFATILRVDSSRLKFRSQNALTPATYDSRSPLVIRSCKFGPQPADRIYPLQSARNSPGSKSRISMCGLFLIRRPTSPRRGPGGLKPITSPVSYRI